MVFENEPSGVTERLDAALACLGRDDLPGALAAYEALLESDGDDGDVLQAISGDLGSSGHFGPIVQLIAPLYDPQRHGPGAGVNLLQAYLALGDPEGADHVRDRLAGFGDPALAERLRGFAGEIARMKAAGIEAGAPGAPPAGAAVAKGTAVSISKPVWFYGLEDLGGTILPGKGKATRRIAFTQLALPGAHPDLLAAMRKPEDGTTRLSRAIPLWLAEMFGFSTGYDAIAAMALVTLPGGTPRPAILDAAWTAENIRELVRTTNGGLDYVITGTLRGGGALELELVLWEVRRMRERKRFAARWEPAAADAELARLREELRRFMEWRPCPDPSGAGHAPEGSPRAWIEALGASLGLFLAGKKLWPSELIPPPAPALEGLGPLAAADPAAALARLTILARARDLGIDPGPATGGALAQAPVVEEARGILGLR